MFRPAVSSLRQQSRISSKRTFASTLDGSILSPFRVFDREVKRMQKDRAAAFKGGEQSRTVDYVRNEVADRLSERFADIKRELRAVLDLGSGAGHFTQLLENPGYERKVTMLDLSRCCTEILTANSKYINVVPVNRVHGDEERLLESIPRNSQDAVVSCLSLHWVNDLPGALIQAREALKPDGVFIGAMFGGDTLFELRTALQLAETEREGGISPRVSPMTQTSDVSNLMARAGFNLLTVDTDEVQVAYPSMWELLEDLRDMGESNAVVERRHFLRRDTLLAASSIYKALHGNEDGSIPATFEVVYMIGWKPDPSQPKPLERGAGKTNLKDVLE
ncbi:hypothetical protein FS837_007816 [Tulasnella sp. UAMH 9824]|nr:hypothetical protein FS837_007816 [Tulasnella sp. UAMH 9824]